MSAKNVAGYIDSYAPVWIALLFTAGVLAVSYPGFMSYDSIRMLQEARTQVYGGIYPAMPVYILRVFDIGGHGPTVMLVVQNFLVFLGLALILRFLKAPWWAAIPVMLAIVAMPVVIGVMLVVWKDVTTTAPMLIAIVLIFWARRQPQAPSREAAKWASMFLLVVATLVRFNSLTATAVIAIYWTLTFYPARRWWKQGGIFLLTLLLMGLSNKIINGYAFPDFRKLAPNGLAYGIMTYDLVGISKWSGEPLVPIGAAGKPALPKADPNDIERIYSSLGVLHIQSANSKLGNPVKLMAPGYVNSDILKAWISAIIAHPVAYARYRLDLFEEIIGTKPHPTFEPTHFNRIDENEYGIKFTERPLTTEVLAYIEAASAENLGKPWPFLLLSIVACAAMLALRTIPTEFKILGAVGFAAAMMYIAPFLIMTGTGEVRYVYPTLIMGSIPVLVLLFGWRHPRPIAAERIL